MKKKDARRPDVVQRYQVRGDEDGRPISLVLPRSLVKALVPSTTDRGSIDEAVGSNFGKERSESRNERCRLEKGRRHC